ncbi:DUF4158 domain-containing protein [Streptomyces sp. NPDC058239]|uniref:DUF4158 domain-containing protein n=1 Tax=Streptomyces sp. NPDC058239 TaxID=3346395 RepID=UPI0036E37E49
MPVTADPSPGDLLRTALDQFPRPEAMVRRRRRRARGRHNVGPDRRGHEHHPPVRPRETARGCPGPGSQRAHRAEGRHQAHTPLRRRSRWAACTRPPQPAARRHLRSEHHSLPRLPGIRKRLACPRNRTARPLQHTEKYLAGQLGIEDASCVKRYPEHRRTPYEHADEIQQRFKCRDFTDRKWGWEFRSFLYGRAWTHAEGPVALFNHAVTWLRKNRVLLPRRLGSPRSRWAG